MRVLMLIGEAPSATSFSVVALPDRGPRGILKPLEFSRLSVHLIFLIGKMEHKSEARSDGGTERQGTVSGVLVLNGYFGTDLDSLPLTRVEISRRLPREERNSRSSR